MYEAFYGLREKPFSIPPDTDFLFPSRKHKRALTLLEYGLLNHVGFSVITGAVGSGKTLLIRTLLKQIGHEISVGLVTNPQGESFEELLRWILLAFGLDFRGRDKVELYQTLSEFLLEEYGRRRRVVLIIDEAQHLGPRALEQLRMLSNINADKLEVLQLVLVGQPSLWRLLRRPELEQFAQRIGVDYYLQPLDAGETREYIQHRVTVAGGKPDLFAEDCHELIWRCTRGVPRLINLLCDLALVYAYAEQSPCVQAGMIHEVLRDRRMSISPIGEHNEEGVQQDNDPRRVGPRGSTFGS